ncbi:MAG: DUF4492 domain-containing protein [Bacteroidales bacterium]|nr:DUF4492 domain-containing protein [Bacteroidales bacterium]
MLQLFKKVALFYINGFKHLPDWGRQVWLIILIKLAVIFLILKLLLMPDLLKKKFDNEKQRIQFMQEQLKL